MPVTVLLTNTNWWPCSAHLAMALNDAGLRVAAVYPKRGHALSQTDAVSNRFTYRATAPLVSLARAIRESGAQWVLPCDDRAVRHLHQLHAAAIAGHAEYAPLLDVIVRSIGDSDAYPIIASRAALLRTAEEVGVPIPVTTSILSAQHLTTELEGKQFPLVMKSDGSWGGLGVKVIHSMEEAQECYAGMVRPLGVLAMLKRVLVNRDAFWFEAWRRQSTPGITVQSFIHGRPANCVVFCAEGKVLAMTAVEVVAAQSATGPATKIRIVEGRQMRQAAEALAHRLKLSGMHGFDFMLDSENGVPYLVELNPRCAMPCHLRVAAGGDLVGALTTELLGHCGERKFTLAPGDEVAYYPQAWLSNPKDESLRAGYHDVPWGEPKLVKELLLLPWPDRGLLARVSDRLRGLSFQHRSALGVQFTPDLLRAPGSIGLQQNVHTKETA